MKKSILFSAAIWLAASCNFAIAADYAVMTWQDLVPDTAELPMAQKQVPALVHRGGERGQQSNYGPVDESLDGKEIKIAGFVVPLDGTDTHVTDFLLVPYFGACSHLPPPPANQIIYVKSEIGVPIDNLMDAVWVSGKLTAQQISYQGIDVGYNMSLSAVAQYQVPAY